MGNFLHRRVVQTSSGDDKDSTLKAAYGIACATRESPTLMASALLVGVQAQLAETVSTH